MFFPSQWISNVPPKLHPHFTCLSLHFQLLQETDNDCASQEAGIPRKLAPTIGISVDARRQTTSQEALALNVDRLKAYKARLILFPRKAGQHKKLDSSAEDVKSASDAKNVVYGKLSAVLPIDSGVGVKHGISEVKKNNLPKEVEGGAYRKLRDARSEARYVGAREKRAKAKADAEDSKKK